MLYYYINEFGFIEKADKLIRPCMLCRIILTLNTYQKQIGKNLIGSFYQYVTLLIVGYLHSSSWKNNHI